MKKYIWGAVAAAVVIVVVLLKSDAACSYFPTQIAWINECKTVSSLTPIASDGSNKPVEVTPISIEPVIEEPVAEEAVTEEPAIVEEVVEAETADAPAEDTETAAVQPTIENETIKPTFDLARVEADGSAVVAGRAIPNATIILKNSGEIIAETTTNETGEWVAIVDVPVTDDVVELTVDSIAKDGVVTSSDEEIKIAMRKVEPVEAATTDTPVVETKIVATPVEETPVAEDATIVEPTEATPAENIVAETTSAETTAEETPVVETAAKQTPPVAETKTEEPTPEVKIAAVDTKTEATPAEDQVAIEQAKPETPVVEAQSVEIASVEAPAVETPAVEAPAVETTVVETPTVEAATAAEPVVETQTEQPAVAEETTEVETAMVGEAKTEQPVAQTKVAAVEPKTETVADAPVVETPVEDTPIEEVVVEETTEVDNTPLVVLTKKGEATKVLQGAGVASEGNEMTFNSLDYNEKGEVIFSGDSKPNEFVRVYINNQFIGQTKSNNNGRWSLDVGYIMQAGKNDMRFDQVDASGTVISRRITAITMPKLKQDTPQNSVVADNTAKDEVKTDETKTILQDNPKNTRAIIVWGDSLWNISQKVYGDGELYIAIFEANKRQIRNPDLIFPGQVFMLPDDEEIEVIMAPLRD